MYRVRVAILGLLAAAHGVAAAQPIPDSQVATGTRDIRRAWLGTPVDRYGHAALGSRTHAATLHVVVAGPSGDQELSLRLDEDRVFEDRLVRLQDLDADGRDEIIVVEARADHGAALVVFNVAGPATAARLQERARSAYVGTMRWLNPVGAADFDGDGRLELASVTTPHIGGILTLYRYDPPRLVPLAREADVSNHRLGAVEQRLSAVVSAPGAAPWVLVPDQSRRNLRMLGWHGDGGWRPVAQSVALPAAVERIEAHPGGACVTLEDGRWLAVSHARTVDRLRGPSGNRGCPKAASGAPAR
ncbi:MAG: VCBS repeat-containing protein [Pseudomonadota bacterium]